MVDRTDETPGNDELRERIRRAVQGTANRELVDVDLSGPEVTVVVDEFTGEGGGRTHVERSLYSVHEEPTVDMDDDDGPFTGEHNLVWSYLGPVEKTDDGWERIEE